MGAIEKQSKTQLKAIAKKLLVDMRQTQQKIIELKRQLKVETEPISQYTIKSQINLHKVQLARTTTYYYLKLAELEIIKTEEQIYESFNRFPAAKYLNNFHKNEIINKIEQLQYTR